MSTSNHRRQVLSTVGRWSLGLGLLMRSGFVLANVQADAATGLVGALEVSLDKSLDRLRLQPVGRGSLRLWGFKVYEAELLLPAGLSPTAALPRLFEESFALRIFYARAISREQLVSRTEEEIRRLGIGNDQRLAAWSAQLSRLWPAVQDGDQITGLHRPGRGAAFYVNGLLTGEITDASFSEAFFRIWLDPKTSSPSLRRALLQLP